MKNIEKANDEKKMIKFCDGYREILLKAKKNGIIGLDESYILEHKVIYTRENNEISPKVENDLPPEVLKEIEELWNDINMR